MNEHPAPKPELINPKQREEHHSRSLWFVGALLITTLLGGGTLFFTNTLSFFSQGHLINPPTKNISFLKASTSLSMISTAQAAKALKNSHFSPDQQTAILEAVKNDKMRLVEMPVLDASGLVGQIVDISVAGLTQRITLTGKFQHLILPISKTGQVRIAPVTLPHAPALNIGALTALGPEVLPSLTTLNQEIILDVIVQ